MAPPLLIHIPLRTADMTSAQRRALETAASREHKNICPVRGIHAAAETAVIKALDRQGYIEWDGHVPRISQLGQRAIAS